MFVVVRRAAPACLDGTEKVITEQIRPPLYNKWTEHINSLFAWRFNPVMHGVFYSEGYLK